MITNISYRQFSYGYRCFYYSTLLIENLPIMKNLFFGALLVGGTIYYNSESTPLPPPTFEEGTKLNIVFKSFEVVEENSIGDDWTFEFFVEGSPLSPKDNVVDVSNLESIIIKSKATENDPSHDDIGYARRIVTPENLSDLLAKEEIVETVFVNEYYGKGAGNTATCEFRYSITIEE